MDSEPQATHLQTGLRVGGQEGLSRAWQEGLARRDEGPRSCRPRLAEVQEPHRPWRLASLSIFIHLYPSVDQVASMSWLL